VIFHSLDYLVFLAAVVAVYWLLPRPWQNALVLAASYVFYGYVHLWYLIPLVCATALDFACGVGMTALPRRRKLLLLLSVGTNLALLGTFKYHGFFVENAAALARAVGLPASQPVLALALPVGISFYTFQSLGYILDVYRGRIEARRNLLDYALFVSFFPQLVAGPIERAEHMFPQVEQPRVFDADRIGSGVLLLLWGFFKKLVIADHVAVLCDKVFALEQPWFPLLWAGVIAFAFQIYADFSGYTDIARGSARLLGFELMENFRHPYLAQSPADFWRRWHLSLSTWFRDYVYIPLGGSRVPPARAAFNLVFTFVLSGFWHGASWNFVFWGLYWGLLVLLERLAGQSAIRRWRLPAVLKVPAMFAATCFGWLLFRETNLSYLGRVLTLSPFGLAPDRWQIAAYLLLLTMLYSLPLWLHALWDTCVPHRVEGRRLWTPTVQWLAQTALAIVLFLGILILGSDTASEFIYFQF
jgi:D-alanyl-lipoteichoic acid acyltransferase DltB (MBOAT superfamily)